MKLVFLIGSGRSGTKFLRDTLIAAEDVTCVPYDINYFWRYGNQNLDHDQIKFSDLTEKQVTWLKRNIFKYRDKDARNKSANVLIEKTVGNTFRVEFLYKLFPDAKFIHLIRDGREVTESAIRLWKKPADLSYLKDKLRYYPFTELSYAYWFVKENIKRRLSTAPPIWGTRYKGIVEDVKQLPLHKICAKQWALGVKTALDDFQSVPSEQYIEVRYSDLVTSHDCISRICKFAEIEESLVTLKWRESVDPSNKAKWLNSLETNVLCDIEDIFHEILPERQDLYR